MISSVGFLLLDFSHILVSSCCVLTHVHTLARAHKFTRTTSSGRLVTGYYEWNKPHTHTRVRYRQADQHCRYSVVLLLVDRFCDAIDITANHPGEARTNYMHTHAQTYTCMHTTRHRTEEHRIPNTPSGGGRSLLASRHVTSTRMTKLQEELPRVMTVETTKCNLLNRHSDNNICNM